jgi:hypothetical protein
VWLVYGCESSGQSDHQKVICPRMYPGDRVSANRTAAAIECPGRRGRQAVHSALSHWSGHDRGFGDGGSVAGLAFMQPRFQACGADAIDVTCP